MAMSKSVELDERARFHHRNMIGSRMLLQALQKNHGVLSTEEAEPVETPPDVAPAIQALTERQIRTYQPWFNIEAEIEPPATRIPSVKLIQDITAKHYGVSILDMLSLRRCPKFVRPRQVAVYLTRMLTPRSMPEIGRLFAGRDHTTILASIRKIDKLLKTEKGLKQKIEAISLDIRGSE